MGVHGDRVTKAYIRKMCAHADLFVRIWSPGDGKARFRFWSRKLHALPGSYFDDDHLFETASGLEARGFISGWMSASHKLVARKPRRKAT